MGSACSVGARCPMAGSVFGSVAIATTATVSAAATAPVALPAAATPRAFFSRTRDVDVQGPSAQVLAIQRFNGLLCLLGCIIVTKANPRGRPVVRSVTRLASTTVPCAAKASCSSFSVTLKSRFPTNNLVLMDVLNRPVQFCAHHNVPENRVSNHHRTGFVDDFHAMEVKNVSRDAVTVACFDGIASDKFLLPTWRGRTNGVSGVTGGPKRSLAPSALAP